MDNPTLTALTRMVGRHGGATAPPRKPKTRNVPKGKAYGWHRKRGTPGANLGPLAGKQMPRGLTDPSDATRSIGPTHPSDASRQANFGRFVGRPVNTAPARGVRPVPSRLAPRRSVPRPPY